jgi:hypothetical protein
MIACCGLDCSKCPAFIATRENDDGKREETAREWSGLYKSEITPDQINCDGCRMDGKKFNFCGKCDIRKCCYAKGVKNCAACDDYICDKLSEFIKHAPEAGRALEALCNPAM